MYLGDDEDPSPTFVGHVGEVLDAQGVWGEVNRRIECDPSGFFDRWEAYRGPIDKLGVLATACRGISNEVNELETYECRENGVRRSVDGDIEHFQVVTTATGEELRQALLSLADLADRASGESRTIRA